MSTVRNSAPDIAASAATAVCVLTASFHAALVFGAPWGEATQGGRMSGTLDAQGRIVAGLSVAILLLMAGSILARTSKGPLSLAPRRAVTVLAWLTTSYAALAVVLNLMTSSAVERAIWTPVSVVLFALIGFVMVRTRRSSDYVDRSSSPGGSWASPDTAEDVRHRAGAQSTANGHRTDV